jgi:hypothetical protein
MNARRCTPIAALLLAGAVSACASTPSSGPSSASGGASADAAVRAQANDTIYIIEHYVRAERRQQFEDFVDSVLWPAFQRAATQSPGSRQAVRSIRMLGTLGTDEDGSHVYVFMLDPAITGESYNVLDMLRAAHGDEEAVRLYSRFTETWAREFTARAYVQRRNPAVQ